jgi:hypothetical protein
MGFYRSLYSSGSGGSLTEPLELEQVASSKEGFIAGRDGESGDVQPLGGLFQAYAASADGSDRGSAVLSKQQNAAANTSVGYSRILALGQTTYFDSPDPGNTNTYYAFGKILGFIAGPYTFNGNTAGATAETTICSGIIPANTIAGGFKVEIGGVGAITGVNGASTLTLKAKIGSTAIVTAVLDVTDNLAEFNVLYNDFFQATGAAAALYRYASISGAANSGSAISAATINTTVSNTYSITAQWSSNNPGNTAAFKYLGIKLTF